MPANKPTAGMYACRLLSNHIFIKNITVKKGVLFNLRGGGGWIIYPRIISNGLKISNCIRPNLELEIYYLLQKESVRDFI